MFVQLNEITKHCIFGLLLCFLDIEEEVFEENNEVNFRILLQCSLVNAAEVVENGFD